MLVRLVLLATVVLGLSVAPGGIPRQSSTCVCPLMFSTSSSCTGCQTSVSFIITSHADCTPYPDCQVIEGNTCRLKGSIAVKCGAGPWVKTPFDLGIGCGANGGTSVGCPGGDVSITMSCGLCQEPPQ